MIQTCGTNKFIVELELEVVDVVQSIHVDVLLLVLLLLAELEVVLVEVEELLELEVLELLELLKLVLEELLDVMLVTDVSLKVLLCTLGSFCDEHPSVASCAQVTMMMKSSQSMVTTVLSPDIVVVSAVQGSSVDTVTSNDSNDSSVRGGAMAWKGGRGGELPGCASGVPPGENCH